MNIKTLALGGTIKQEYEETDLVDLILKPETV